MRKELLVLLLVCGAAVADDNGLRKCRGIPEPAARLACYDALALPPVGAVPATAAPAASAAVAPAQAKAAAPAPTPQQQFGLERRAPKDELQTIESYIAGHFEGWEARSVITLANGQVWQVSDGSSLYMYRDNPKVTIRRGALGTFFMDFEKENRSPRVTRLR